MDARLDLLLIWFPSRAKDAVAALIKRLAHRNANVQLYTLEVCQWPWRLLLFGTDGLSGSSPMRWRRTVVLRFIASWRRGASLMRFCDLRMTV